VEEDDDDEDEEDEADKEAEELESRDIGTMDEEAEGGREVVGGEEERVVEKEEKEDLGDLREEVLAEVEGDNT
jgi:hypothetical protein